MTPLRQRMIEDMQLRNFATTTQRSYIHYVAGYALFYNTSPDHLDLEAVRQRLERIGRKLDVAGLDRPRGPFHRPVLLLGVRGTRLHQAKREERCDERLYRRSREAPKAEAEKRH